MSEPTPEYAPDTTPTAATQPEGITIPKARFDEVNERLKALLAEQEATKTAQAEREKAELAKRAEYETLWKQADAQAAELSGKIGTMAAELQAAQDALGMLWESKKGVVPEAYRPLVEKLPLHERLAWLAENEEKIKPQSPPVNGTPSHRLPTGNGTKVGALTPKVRF
jgi:hypothetical protein